MQQTRNTTPSEFDEKIVQIRRVSKKTKGGNTIGFSVLVVVGDKKGRVGCGMEKAPTVAAAIKKAVAYAKKHLITVPMKKTTIPHEVLIKHGAARLFMKPAPAGSGVIAGGAVRAVFEVVGVRDVVAKMIGSRNQAANVYAAIEAFKRLKRVGNA